MKLLGVRADPLSGVRRRVALKAAAAVQSTDSVREPDSAVFLGIDEAELTPAVRAALAGLINEIEELRVEVGRLKAHLTEAEGLADRDALTPLLNRRAFLRELKRVTTFSQRYGSPASLITPECGLTSPMAARNRVVLPAPLPPSTPRIWPPGRLRLIRSRTSRRPRRTLTPSRLRAGITDASSLRPTRKGRRRTGRQTTP